MKKIFDAMSRIETISDDALREIRLLAKEKLGDQEINEILAYVLVINRYASWAINSISKMTKKRGIDGDKNNKGEDMPFLSVPGQ